MGSSVIAVDVGTGSARAGIYDRSGRLLGRGQSPILLNRPDALVATQDSGDIWRAVGAASRQAVKAAAINPADIAGLCFDATCSLVLLDQGGNPLETRQGDAPNWNVIAWMDHRAIQESSELSTIKGDVVDHVGGRFSPEMQLPKLAWLKRRQPAIWSRLGTAFDLSDYLASRAVGQTVRSLNTAVTKWSYLAHGPGWDRDFLVKAGLSDLLERTGITGVPAPLGSRAGLLSSGSAADMGLAAGTPVSYGMVDAFAGGVSLLGSVASPENHAALIGGTSNCVMRQTSNPIRLAGFWGPFHDAVLPGLWVTEGGQSAAGALLDQIIGWHCSGTTGERVRHEDLLVEIDHALKKDPDWASDLHVLPDFHGSRSPLADPSALGVIHGLALDGSREALRRLYWRTLVGIALGIRSIVDTFDSAAGRIDIVHLGGGHARNPLMVQLYADVLNRPVGIAAGEEAMLLGGAMVAATAAGFYPGIETAAASMARPLTLTHPEPSSVERLERDHRVFRAMLDHRAEIASLSRGLTPG